MQKRMKTPLINLCFLFLAFSAFAESPQLLSLKPISGMTRAHLYYAKIVKNPKAILVLSPGCNGNGKRLIENSVWQSFAAKQNIALIGLSFASKLEDLHNGKGYYYASNGSGDLLLKGIKKLFNQDIPILLYGFSGGAHFTSRFVEWKPERVIAWCAYSAGWWNKPKSSKIMPPGIVACGENDNRLGASLIYFKQGRNIEKPWLWIGIPKNGHSPDRKVELFVRDYFKILLKNQGVLASSKTGIWVDIDKKYIAKKHVIKQYPSLTAWLPNSKLLPSWQSLNSP